MGAGGVVQQHAALLVTAVSDQSIYSRLTDDEKDRFELIRAKSFVDRDEDDVAFLKEIIGTYC